MDLYSDVVDCYHRPISTDLAKTRHIPEPVAAAVSEAVAGLGRAGRWWTASQRLAIASVAREASPRPLWDRRPPLETIPADDGEPLSPFVSALVELIAVETSSINRETVDLVSERIGDAAYAEMSAIVAQVAAIDQLSHSLGIPLAPFPAPSSGQPSRERPDGMGDVGGHIHMSLHHNGANVARSLSLAAEDHDRWRGLVLSMYSRDAFLEMVWTNRALSRPQIELLAARTSALNQCFY